MNLSHLQMEANKARFDASNAYSSFDTYSSYKYAQIPDVRTQTNGMYGLDNNTRLNNITNNMEIIDETKSHRSFANNGQSIIQSNKQRSAYFDYD